MASGSIWVHFAVHQERKRTFTLLCAIVNKFWADLNRATTTTRTITPTLAEMVAMAVAATTTISTATRVARMTMMALMVAVASKIWTN